MKTTEKIKLNWALLTAILLPAGLCALFSLLKRDTQRMDLWVFGVMGPLEQALGRFWSLFPFSVAEVLTALALAGSVLWLVRALVLLLHRGQRRCFLRRMAALAAVWLWVLAGFNWLWNASYYASTFSQRSGLTIQTYSVEELRDVTRYFAHNAARLSDQIARDKNGHFQAALPDCFKRAPQVYQNLTSEFPCLSMASVEVKPLLCSRLQSILGFTGIYFPFTGEANVNVDAPACLIPATIAHEMAHQRMIASELEANFVGIAACTTSDDTVFQYSGYLMGLIQLCNALYSVDPHGWYDIAEEYFTPELFTDWNDNNAYWASFDSTLEEVAERTYDQFLKSNDQELGMRSYGACVDLLVAYYGPLAR